MARCRVTYREAADGRSVRSHAGDLLELEVDAPPDRPSWVGEVGAAPVRTPPAPPRRRSLWPWAVGSAALLVVVVGVELARSDGNEPAASPDPPVTHAVVSEPGPVAIATASVLAEPWGGVFEHHPDTRGMVSVPRVHLVSLDGEDARVLLVVDATRRAFGGAEHTSSISSTRVLGAPGGRGLRTLQWDAGGYGLSLTSEGLSLDDQQAVADAVELPPGPSLQHGRAPGLDEAALAAIGLSVTERRSGTATAYGSPMIGQSGGGSVEGQLHRSGADPLLVSVVQDQLVTASRVRRTLGDAVDIDLTDLPGIVSAAALDHGPGPDRGRRIRGWARLVLDHEVGVTIELSSDVLAPAQLAEVARSMQLGRLARTASPTAGG
ncbi:hypothetical protein NHL50_07495 [Acidimicrobiia bacterium EGI L10123]|uniref:hypothetical protein n=1 Tax=Salinilacustrithrix flava TaxID=2957203 RepID=UPI003D7C2EDA|nr:hypothetical protein [Acidimicrobiia bacterium EGI L10123]